MTIYTVYEECEGEILYAVSEKAAKRALLETGWVESDAESVWVEDEMGNDGHWASLEELYGEHWKEEFLKMDRNGLYNMGFRIYAEEVWEEE